MKRVKEVLDRVSRELDELGKVLSKGKYKWVYVKLVIGADLEHYSHRLVEPTILECYVSSLCSAIWEISRSNRSKWTPIDDVDTMVDDAYPLIASLENVDCTSYAIAICVEMTLPNSETIDKVRELGYSVLRETRFGESIDSIIMCKKIDGEVNPAKTVRESIVEALEFYERVFET